MEHNQFRDHEYRLRDLEKALNQLDIKLRELAFAQSAASQMLHNIVPKLEGVIEDNRLAERLEKQLKKNEQSGWTRRERYMGVWVVVMTTVAPIINHYYH